jgi:hypothetical protein
MYVLFYVWGDIVILSSLVFYCFDLEVFSQELETQLIDAEDAEFK